MMLPDRFFDDMFEFDVPRTQKERMECDVYEEDGNIIITAEKNENSKEEDKNKKYLRRERHFHSRTQRAFYLGDIDEDNIKATFDNGVLKVTVPKKQIESNRKLIDIE